MDGVNAIIKGHGAVPGPNGNFRLFSHGVVHTQGNRGTGVHVVVVVAHGSADKLAGYGSWASFKQNAGDGIDWKNMDTLYLAACKTNQDSGSAFHTRNIATQAKQSFPNATVWASSSGVGNRSPSGDWHRL